MNLSFNKLLVDPTTGSSATSFNFKDVESSLRSAFTAMLAVGATSLLASLQSLHAGTLVISGNDMTPFFVAAVAFVLRLFLQYMSNNNKQK